MEAFKKSMKIIFILLITIFLIISLFISKHSKTERILDLDNIKYVEESEISNLYKDPDKFKNKGIKLQAKVFNLERYNKDIYLQASVEIDGKNKNILIAYYGSDQDIKNQDTILVDGIIQGSFEGKNRIGTIIKIPTILALHIN